MSFILDALRKSENERQRNQQPGLANVQVQKTRRGSGFWVPLVALLIGVNLSLLLVMWVMSDKNADPAAAGTTAPVAGPTTTPDNVAEYSAGGRKLSEAMPSAAATANGAATNAGASAPIETPTDVYASNSQEEYDNVPTLEELLLANEIALEPLHLDIHVYSDNPQERFVFINLSKYLEGETLNEGPRVIAISKTGVILRHQGKEFLITRE